MKLIICLGPCCAGKSTWCKKYLVKNPDAVRFGVDEFKMMLRGDLSNDIMDKEFILMSYDLILRLLLKYKHVIVDGYFFDIHYLRMLTGMTSDHEIRLFSLSFRESTVRNAVRKKKTGLHIDMTELRRFYDKYEAFVDSKEFRSFSKTIKLRMNENDYDNHY